MWYRCWKRKDPEVTNQVIILNQQEKSIVYLDDNEAPLYVESSYQVLSIDCSSWKSVNLEGTFSVIQNIW